ncbi:MAG TPA: protein kinase [Kofleriaceae bacterium]|nr:protein kinase [Kofleriaceae bacterium]
MTATITCAGCTYAYADTALFCPNCGRPKVREFGGDTLLGKVLGERFQVQALLGQGGSGTIYRAEHITLRRKVAIKVLHAELSRDDLAVERFRREATTVAEIDNEHIVEIHDFGRAPDGRLYLAMELLEGETLDAVLARERTLSVERTADILIQVGEALMEAHAIGYVHRDLRPRNVYLAVRRGKANFVKLLDFGLAKLVETDASAASTSLGMTFGDPRYMAPEQARGDRIDRRADIYQLGCVAYEMLTGAPPFSGNRVFDILTKQVTEAPQPLPSRRRDVPLWMEAAVTKMLAKDPDNRFATTTRMVEALRRGLETGEVMEDEIARRRESIPPPSVSRVMHKMGLSQPADPPAPATTFDGTLTIRGHSSIDPSAPVVAPSPVVAPPSVVVQPPVVAPPSVVVPQAAQEPFLPGQTRQGLGVPAKPDSVELLRKRTGTPRLGVPVTPTAAPAAAMTEGEGTPLARSEARTSDPGPRESRGMTPPEDPTQAPVAGVIEQPRTRAEAGDQLSTSSTARAKRPSGEDAQNISGVWFEDDDDASSRPGRARKTISPSVTDLALDDELPRRRRWGFVIGALALLIGGVALAVTLGRGSSSGKQPEQPALAPTVPPDAAPSTIIEAPDAAAIAAAPPTAPDAAAAPPVVARTGAPPSSPPPTGRRPDDLSYTPPPDPGFRRPGGGSATPTPPTGTGGGGPKGVSGNDTPQDPYGTPDSPAATPAKQAEFFANLGAQQLASGDAANAAANFKKALELDPKSAPATIGMGEIALRQGLFGDAIAHLQKASRLAPRSARVFTLLGEAFLSLGRNSDAAANFKKALQIDPDNARARDGYNEASSRVPSPGDE